MKNESFEDAEVFYPSKMNEENSNALVEKEIEQVEVQPFYSSQYRGSNFTALKT